MAIATNCSRSGTPPRRLNCATASQRTRSGRHCSSSSVLSRAVAAEERSVCKTQHDQSVRVCVCVRSGVRGVRTGCSVLVSGQGAKMHEHTRDPEGLVKHFCNVYT